MAGYIGSKAVNLSTTGADINGNANIDGNLSFGDNNKAIFGAGSDLQIYHDGSRSIIQDSGTGNLLIRASSGTYIQSVNGENGLAVIENGTTTAYFDGDPRIATTNAGVDVTGVLSSDGLTVDASSSVIQSATGTSSPTPTTFNISTTSSASDWTTTSPWGRLAFYSGDSSGSGGKPHVVLDATASNAIGASSSFSISTTSESSNTLSKRLNINNIGDISFYNDSGSAKLFWDASDQDLTITPNSGNITIKAGTHDATNNVRLEAGGTTSTYLEYRGYLGHIWDVNTTEAMRIDSSGNVGIGTSSPTRQLDVSKAGTAYIRASDTANSVNVDMLAASSGGWIGTQSNHSFQFQTNNAERMRIDSSGNLLVGKTSTSINTAGSRLIGGGAGAQFTADATEALALNRLTNDGDLIWLGKAGTKVGSIGTVGGQVFLATSGQVGLRYKAVSVTPCNASGTDQDNVIDLGQSGIRFDDVYATNGTIQTSDRNEKQDIEALSDAERRVAVACKGLLRKFRWINSVAEKGDDARIHFGIIAQDLQDAFTAEGLDAGDYAMFISSTWWETQTEVPAVEAVAEVTETTTDEDGNEVVTVVTEAVEAVDAYTRTDTYDTQEEAPEGATERTRLGVRYSELLAFIIGAL